MMGKKLLTETIIWNWDVQNLKVNTQMNSVTVALSAWKEREREKSENLIVHYLLNGTNHVHLINVQINSKLLLLCSAYIQVFKWYLLSILKILKNNWVDWKERIMTKIFVYRSECKSAGWGYDYRGKQDWQRNKARLLLPLFHFIQ